MFLHSDFGAVPPQPPKAAGHSNSIFESVGSCQLSTIGVSVIDVAGREKDAKIPLSPTHRGAGIARCGAAPALSVPEVLREAAVSEIYGSAPQGEHICISSHKAAVFEDFAPPLFDVGSSMQEFRASDLCAGTVIASDLSTTSPQGGGHEHEGWSVDFGRSTHRRGCAGSCGVRGA